MPVHTEQADELDQVQVLQCSTWIDGKTRIVLEGEFKLDYFNVRDGVTDIVVTARS